MAVNAALHVHTPTLVALTPRGDVARRVRYGRRPGGMTAVAHIDRIERTAAGRLHAAWDARLTVPSLKVRTSLSDARVRTEHVDAGWRIVLFGADGAPRFEWDARGVERRIVYDDRQRPAEVHEGIGTLRCLDRFTYGIEPGSGTSGRLVRHEDTAGSVAIAGYGVRGEVLAERRRFLREMDPPDWPADEAARDALLEPESFVTRWAHDALGARRAQWDSGGHHTRTGVDVAGQARSLHLTMAGGREQTVSSDVVHDAQGRVVARRDGEVQTLARFREGDGRQVGMRREAKGRALQDLTYAYDGVGNVLSMEDAVLATDWFDPGDTDPVHRYVYDTLDQLVEASGRESMQVDGAIERPLPLLAGSAVGNRLRDYVETCEYDTGGNLERLTHVAAGEKYVREFAVRPDSNRAVLLEPGYAPVFDACGNLLQLKPGMPLRWDTRGRLAQTGAANGAHESYHYDSAGMRVRKRSADGEVRYLPGWERRRAADESDVVEILHLAHAETAIRAIYTKGTAEPPVLRLQIADILHSVTLETTAEGEVLTEEAFHPYGGSARWAARGPADAQAKVRRYGGKESDASQLSYYGYRYYAPWLGRWISPDPAGDIDGLNRYRFAQNNPGSGVDQDGLMVRRPSRRVSNPIVHLKLRKHLQNAVATGREGVARQLGVASGANTVAVDLVDVLTKSRTAIRRAEEVLRTSPEDARPRVASYLGVSGLADAQWEQTRQSLSSGFAQIGSHLEDLMGEGGSRLVLVHYPEKPNATKLKPNAFVIRDDPEQRVFINRANVQRIGNTPLRNTLIHELSHQLPSPLKTFDVLYASEGQLEYEAGQFQPPAVFNPLSIEGRHLAAKSIGMSYYGMSPDERKASLMMRNADTWAAIAIGLERQHEDY